MIRWDNVCIHCIVHRKKPPTIGPGLFTWFKVIKNTADEELLDKIGYDAVLFIAFIRMLRQLMTIMTVAGVCLLIPLNILANRFTGYVHIKSKKEIGRGKKKGLIVVYDDHLLVLHLLNLSIIL
jgi:hypothetical protein